MSTELQEAQRRAALLREALAGLVGVETPAELDHMELIIRQTEAPSADKTAVLNALHALRETA